MRRGVIIVGLLAGGLLLVLWLPGASSSPQAVTRSPTSAPTTVASTTVIRPPQPTIAPPDSSSLRQRAHASLVGWFDAIYRADAEALTRWVATPALLEAGLAAIAEDSVRFTAEPSGNVVGLDVDEVLRHDEKCVALRTTEHVGRFVDADVPSRTVVTVYWPDEGGRLRMAARWGAGTPSVVWQGDCASASPGTAP